MAAFMRLPACLCQRWGLRGGSRLGVLATKFRLALLTLESFHLTCTRTAWPCWTRPSTHCTAWPAQQDRRLCPAPWCLHEFPRVCLHAVSRLAGRPQCISISQSGAQTALLGATVACKLSPCKAAPPMHRSTRAS